ncbi:MAG: hypothetical protein AAF423_09795 [Pseudomonadota bacterium]
MSSYQQGNNDANSGKGPQNVSNQPWQSQQQYNAGYANGNNGKK